MTKEQLNELEVLNKQVECEIQDDGRPSSESYNRVIEFLPEIVQELRSRETVTVSKIEQKEILEGVKNISREIAGLRKHLGMIAHE